jgi:tyrosine-protein phosphatase YwqE
MFSRLFNRSKKADYTELSSTVTENPKWGFLGADMHSHLVPGIDDGAKTIEDSLSMIRSLADMGFKTIITTPHTMIDFYPNTTQTIQDGLKKLQMAVQEQHIPVSIKAASEYYIDEHFINLIDTEPLLTIYDNEVLVEFSMLFEPPMLFDVIYKMQQAGYRPVIAHPERYLFFHKDFRKYRDLRDRGCLLQLNMLSVCGHYGRNIKAIADELLAKQLYDYCGTDIHHEKHVAILRAMAGSKDYLIFANYPFLNPRLCI